MEWPANPFWDYSLALYRQAAVEAACLELQRRHGLDVNLVLLCCWQASRGGALDAASLRRAQEAVASWQTEVVRPLRALRQRLKVSLAQPEPGSIGELWPALAGALRVRALALELDGERLAQLALARALADLPARAPSGVALAGTNLRHYWPFDGRDRHALESLLAAAFPDATPAAARAALAWLAD
jgi:uncharacterized protein (TIGR02444 family)